MKELSELSERWVEWCFIMNKITSPLCLCWNAIMTVQVTEKVSCLLEGHWNAEEKGTSLRSQENRPRRVSKMVALDPRLVFGAFNNLFSLVSLHLKSVLGSWVIPGHVLLAAVNKFRTCKMKERWDDRVEHQSLSWQRKKICGESNWKGKSSQVSHVT